MCSVVKEECEHFDFPNIHSLMNIQTMKYVSATGLGESILFITDLLACYLHRDTWCNQALQPLTHVLIALRFYASGSFLQVMGDTIGVDKSTISRVVIKVSRALVAR